MEIQIEENITNLSSGERKPFILYLELAIVKIMARMYYWTKILNSFSQVIC